MNESFEILKQSFLPHRFPRPVSVWLFVALRSLQLSFDSFEMGN
jgi:hypothetical protein